MTGKYTYKTKSGKGYYTDSDDNDFEKWYFVYCKLKAVCEVVF